MTTKASDTFTGGGTTNLTDHTPDTGTGWTERTAGHMEVSGGTVVITGNNRQLQVSREDTDIGDDDMDVSLTLKAAPIISEDNTDFGPAGRIPSGAFNGRHHYRGVAKVISDTSLLFELIKRIDTTETSLGTHADDPAVNDVLKLEIRTGAKKLFVNGVEKISSTDDSLTGNNFAGIAARADFPYKGDDFLSEDVAVGGVIIAVPLATLTVADQVPDVASGKNVAVPLDAQTIADQVPAVGTSVLVTVPTPDAISIANLVTAVAAGKSVAVPIDGITETAFVLVITAEADVIIAVPLAMVSLSDLVPLIAAGASVASPVNGITVAGQTPAVASGKNVKPPADVISLANFVPVVSSGGLIIAVPLNAISLANLVPLVASGKNVKPPADVISVFAFIPAVAATPIGPVSWFPDAPGAGTWVEESAAAASWAEESAKLGSWLEESTVADPWIEEGPASDSWTEETDL